MCIPIHYTCLANNTFLRLQSFKIEVKYFYIDYYIEDVQELMNSFMLNMFQNLNKRCLEK